MNIKRFTRTTEGDTEILWILTPQQEALLINYAIESLLAKGLVHAVDMTEEEYKKNDEELQSQIALKFLNSIDPDKMPQA